MSSPTGCRGRRAAAAAQLAVRAGTSAWLFPGAPAHIVRWRIATGGWHRLRLSGRVGGWKLSAPSAPQTLTVEVRYRQGGGARFALRLVPLR